MRHKTRILRYSFRYNHNSPQLHVCVLTMISDRLEHLPPLYLHKLPTSSASSRNPVSVMSCTRLAQLWVRTSSFLLLIRGLFQKYRIPDCSDFKLSHALLSNKTSRTEGPWDKVHQVIGQAHTMLHQQGILRIQSDIRVGSRSVPICDDLSYFFHSSMIELSFLHSTNTKIVPRTHYRFFTGPTNTRRLKIRFLLQKGCWKGRYGHIPSLPLIEAQENRQLSHQAQCATPKLYAGALSFLQLPFLPGQIITKPQTYNSHSSLLLVNYPY